MNQLSSFGGRGSERSLEEGTKELGRLLAEKGLAVAGLETIWAPGSEGVCATLVNNLISLIQTGAAESSMRDQHLEVVARLKNDIQAQDRTIVGAPHASLHDIW